MSSTEQIAKVLSDLRDGSPTRVCQGTASDGLIRIALAASFATGARTLREALLQLGSNMSFILAGLVFATANPKEASKICEMVSAELHAGNDTLVSNPTAEFTTFLGLAAVSLSPTSESAKATLPKSIYDFIAGVDPASFPYEESAP